MIKDREHFATMEIKEEPCETFLSSCRLMKAHKFSIINRDSSIIKFVKILGYKFTLFFVNDFTGAVPFDKIQVKSRLFIINPVQVLRTNEYFAAEALHPTESNDKY